MQVVIVMLWEIPTQVGNGGSTTSHSLYELEQFGFEDV